MQRPDAVVFIGDEVSAAGYRLAGVRVRVPEVGEAPAEMLDWGLGHSRLLLLGSDFAAGLPAPALAAAQAGLTPLVLVVPDLRGRVAPADLAAELRDRLGMGVG